LVPGFLKTAVSTVYAVNNIMQLRKMETPEYIGGVLATTILSFATSPLQRMISNSMIQVSNQTEVVNGRSWPVQNGELNDGRMIKKMKVVFHDAFRAGQHLDIHLGKLSLVIRVPSTIGSKLKYNSSGELTIASKDRLIEFLSDKIDSGVNLPQNRDHTVRDASMTWMHKEPGLDGYGSGATRQPILESDVEFVSINGDTIRMYAPDLYKHGQTFLHRLTPGGSNGSAPIVSWGKTPIGVRHVADRLNLRTIGADQVDKFKEKVDPRTVTKKYDGGSAYFESGLDQTDLWSPRVSKETKRHIEYSHKVPEIFRIRSKIATSGMGELLFKKEFNILKPWQDLNLSAAEIGGVLNADRVRPRGIVPEFRIYRMDTFGGKKVIDLDFFQNRKLAEVFIKAANTRFMKLPQFEPIRMKKGVEGLVGVPVGGSIKDGFKIKWVEDAQDWKLETVNLRFGPKGKIAGVVWFKSLESGKRFKMGANQIGNESFVKEIMNLPNNFIGRVFKVSSRVGHEGRAAKVIEPHLDKGAS
jgi:hypothetical protein